MKTKLFFTLFLFTIALKAVAQPGKLDTTFNTSDTGFDTGPNNIVYATSIQTDDKIIIAGDFTIYNGISKNRIARLNTNGTLDFNFNPGTGANGTILTIDLQSDGKIIIGGDFTSYSGISRNRIARLNTNGTLDFDFNPGTGANAQVKSILLQSDGKIIIGGNFTSYNGAARSCISRINIDGTIDNSFNIGTGFGNSVNSTSIQSDGKIIIGGSFATYNGIASSRIVRINTNGTIDNTFNIGAGFNDQVSATTIQSDGKIIVAGRFDTYKQLTCYCVVRLNSDGTKDSSFSSPYMNNQGLIVNKISIQSDNKIIVAGDFLLYLQESVHNIVRLNPNGLVDSTFNTMNDKIYSFSILTDGRFILGGDSFFANGRVLRKNTDGTPDNNFNLGTGANGTVSFTSIQNDGKIIIGGNFRSYNNNLTHLLTRVNLDGTFDDSFNQGLGINNNVYASAAQADGKIIIGGDFTTYNGISSNRIARLNLDGSLDSSFNFGTGANGTVSKVLFQSDGKILIGGDFTNYNGTSINKIVRLNPDGSIDGSFNPGGSGPNFQIRTISLKSDGKIIIGGNFTTYNGVLTKSVAILNSDGTLYAGASGTGPNGIVYCSAVNSDGGIIIGGDFTAFNGITFNRIGLLTEYCTRDPNGANSYGGTDSTVRNIIIQNDGKILISGYFTTCNGIGRNRIARLNDNLSLDTVFNPGSGADNAIHTMSIQNDNKIIIGGDFISYNGTGRNRIARIKNNIALEVRDFGKENIVIYPNPTKNTFHINFEKEFTGALFDITGKTLINVNTKDIDISSLSAGIYLLNIISEGKHYISKIIKQ